MLAKPRPVPRPPLTPPWQIQLNRLIGLAVERDGRLNPEEAKVRLKTKLELDPDLLTGPVLQPEDYQTFRYELRRRQRYFRRLLEEHGWKYQGNHAPHRSRMEGFHPSGAIVQVIMKVKPHRMTFKMSLYVMAIHDGGGATWRSVNSRSFQAFLANPTDRVKGTLVRSACTCTKSGHPSRRHAEKAVFKLKMNKFATKRAGIAGHVYRCWDDDRTWHYTRQRKPRWQKPQGIWAPPPTPTTPSSKPSEETPTTTGDSSTTSPTTLPESPEN